MLRSDSSITGFILRFRDLVTAPGDTIRMHRTLCSGYKYTWWGWWNRGEERVPYSLFTRLKFLAVTEAELNVYLFDSGAEQLYEAKCVDIQFDAIPQSPILSPEPESTPEYYREQKCLAWFKLTSISDQPIQSQEVIGQYSYVSIPDLFVEERPYDKNLHNKVIASTRELRLQGRTVFFLKKAKSTDDAKEVIGKLPLDVFLCHTSNDKTRVRILYNQLKEKGLAPWLDEENILPGQDWKFEILKSIKSCDIVIVCLSNNSVSKEGFVQKEISHALDIADEKPEGAIYLVPVKFEPCEVPERLKRWQYVDLYKKNGYEKLFLTLKARADSLRKHWPKL